MMVSQNPSSKLILVRSEEMNVAPCDTGEHVKELVCFAPAPLSARCLVSHSEALLLKGESECKLCMNAVVVWMCIRKPL